MSDSIFDQNEVHFCCFCGAKLDENARFCKKCGKEIVNVNKIMSDIEISDKAEYEEFIQKPNTERKTVYDGSIHKCPSCGEVLEAFITNCPSCGHELRDKKSTSSTRELAMKLEKIDAQKMPVLEEKESIMKMIIGKDFKNDDDVKEAKLYFERQKQKEKANLILNYSIPNTKEDIMEFMLLASSNIDAKHEINDDVTKAWILKLDQIYEKAMITMESSPEFIQIKRIYEYKKKQLKDRKIRIFLITIGSIAGYFFLLGLLWNVIATITITFVLVSIVFIGYILFKKR